MDESSLRSDVSPRVRFFVFTEKPDPRRLVKVSGSEPVPFETRKFTVDELIGEVYQRLLSRNPSRSRASRRAGVSWRARSRGRRFLLMGLRICCGLFACHRSFSLFSENG